MEGYKDPELDVRLQPRILLIPRRLRRPNIKNHVAALILSTLAFGLFSITVTMISPRSYLIASSLLSTFSSFLFTYDRPLTSSQPSIALPGDSPLNTFLPLRLTSEGTFQISIFEDLHYGEAEDEDWGPAQDVATEKVMNTVLDTESPQLVVLNGDLITGENTYRENSSDYVDSIVRPMVERGLPWASTYGNHDSQVRAFSLMFCPHAGLEGQMLAQLFI